MDSTTYAKQYTRKTICHPPQHPGFTCWAGAWMMPDDSIMISLTQATGALESRPQAPKDILDKLSWPPGHSLRYD